MYIIPENSSVNEIPAKAGILAFGKKQNRSSEKFKPDQSIYDFAQETFKLRKYRSFRLFIQKKIGTYCLVQNQYNSII